MNSERSASGELTKEIAGDGMRKSTNPLWGVALCALLAVEIGVSLEHGHFTDAAIVGVILIPVVAFLAVRAYRHH